MQNQNDDAFDPVLLTTIAKQYGLSLHLNRRLSGGDECEIWLADSRQGPVVIRISPPWRSPAQLKWTHDLTRSIQTQIPEVVPPILNQDGSSLIILTGRPAALYPFIAGQILDRENSTQRIAAAGLLTRLHRAMSASPIARQAPTFQEVTDTHLPTIVDPEEIHDPALDAWRAELESSPGYSTIGVIHGDFYQRNLILTNGTIHGLIDWDEAHKDFIMQEIAWSTWEFCKAPSGDHLMIDRAQDFLSAYRSANDRCRADEFRHVIPFIRWRLRQEILLHFAALAAGEPSDAEYAAAEIRAFHLLKDQVM